MQKDVAIERILETIEFRNSSYLTTKQNVRERESSTITLTEGMETQKRRYKRVRLVAKNVHYVY